MYNQELPLGNFKTPDIITISFLCIIFLHNIPVLFYFHSHIKEIGIVYSSPVLQNTLITLTYLSKETNPHSALLHTSFLNSSICHWHLFYMHPFLQLWLFALWWLELLNN